MPSSPNQRTHTIAVVAVFAAAAGILAFLILRPGVTTQRPFGVVQPTEIKIAPEISGHLLRFAVAPGQSVSKGDTLAELSNPELEAGLVLAQAQLGQARALRNRVYAGSRQERVDAHARYRHGERWFTRSNNLTGLRNWLRPASLRTRTSTRRLPPPRPGTRTSRVQRSDTRPPVSGRRVRNVRSPMPRLKLPSRQLL